jgi:hypothetical protein
VQAAVDRHEWREIENDALEPLAKQAGGKSPMRPLVGDAALRV